MYLKYALLHKVKLKIGICICNFFLHLISLELILIMYMRSVYFELFNRIIYIYIDLMILIC